MKIKVSLIVLLLLLTIPVLAQDDEPETTSELALSGTPSEICEAATPSDEPETREFSAPEEVLEADVDYAAIFCTSAGSVYIDLFETFTPLTVNNFVFLAESNYYNNTIFHRVIEDFMAQGGDPTGTGSGGPGYRFQDEIVNFLQFNRSGLLAMANSGPATNGSQFFITTEPTPWLNGNHTIFGEVLDGQVETVDNILLRDPQAGGDATTLDTVVIIRDKSLVDSDYLAPENLAAGIDSVLTPDALTEDLEYSGAEVQDLETVVTNAPEDLQEDYRAFLEENGLAYRINATVENITCTEQINFFVISYSTDAFTDDETADAVAASDFLTEYYDAIGFAPVETVEDLPFAYYPYLSDTTFCDSEAQMLTVDIPRGRYVVNVSIILSVVEDDQLVDVAAGIASNVPPLFESGLSISYQLGQITD